MKEAIAKLVVVIFLVIIYGFILKYIGKDITIICLLIQIYAELIIKREIE